MLLSLKQSIIIFETYKEKKYLLSLKRLYINVFIIFETYKEKYVIIFEIQDVYLSLRPLQRKRSYTVTKTRSIYL